MPRRKMHADELELDAGLVRRLLAEQFPEWAGLPVSRLSSSGTDNALFRLGDELVARLPRIHWAVGGVENDLEWLPKVAPLLPVKIPVPLAKGLPGEGYPWVWGLYPWIQGELAVAGAAGVDIAPRLARFVDALHRIDLPGGPRSGRGGPLLEHDEPTRAAIAELNGLVDTEAVTAAWEEALCAPEWSGSPVWLHGDLMPSNLLLRDGRLAAVIDWGGLGVGDPAADLVLAWNLLDAATRHVFRAELGADDATWARGRGWALSTAVIAIPYYKETNPALADNARYRIREVLGERP
jgi:aminoglycoside phosphotransferase (APT) family kinase protein